MNRSWLACLVLLASCSSETSGSPPVDSGADAETSGKLTFAATCTMPPACGGVLSGAYTLVSGCTNFSDDCKNPSAYGSLEGSFEVKSGDAGEYLDWKENLKYFSCPSIGTAFVDLGGKHTISGNTVSLTMFGTPVVYEYCVMGEDLWLARAKDSFSRLTVHHFKRK